VSPADIVRVLSELRGPFSEEEKLRDAIAIALGPHALREAKVGEHERIDFLVGRIGIEAKIRGTRSDVTRQLFRYAESPDIDEIILVTTRYQHTVRAPTALLGKPLTIVVCWGAML
jgi:hypothetical protein